MVLTDKQLDYLKTLPSDRKRAWLEKLKQNGSADTLEESILNAEQKSVADIEDKNYLSEQSKEDILESRRLLRQNRGVQWFTLLENVLSRTIKNDRETSLITFFSFLSAFTESDQLNVLFNAPSSSGKTYIAKEIASLFPKESIIQLGSVSPTAFWHDYSKFDEKTKELIIDMSRKIYIFLDQPHFLLLEKLRPLLSHDDKEILIKITDKTQRFGLRTKTIKILGFPVVVFCSAKLDLNEQEATRFLLLSPETSSAEKNKAAVLQAIKRVSNPSEYQKELQMDQERNKLMEHIALIRQSRVRNINIPNPNLLLERFLETIPNGDYQGRHARDIVRVASLAKGISLLYIADIAPDSFWSGEADDIEAKDQHTNLAVDLWAPVSEAQQLNLPPFVYEIYDRVLLPLFHKALTEETDHYGNTKEVQKGVTRTEVFSFYRKIYKRTLPEYQFRREIIPLLTDAGLVYEEPDSGNKRQLRLYPTMSSPLSNKTENNENGRFEQPKGITDDPVKKDGITDIVTAAEKIFGAKAE